jgi:hypothetical protein
MLPSRAPPEASDSSGRYGMIGHRDRSQVTCKENHLSLQVREFDFFDRLAATQASLTDRPLVPTEPSAARLCGPKPDLPRAPGALDDWVVV